MLERMPTPSADSQGPESRERVARMKSEGWRNAGEISIYWGNIVRTRGAPRRVVETLANNPEFTDIRFRSNGEPVRLFSPQALIRVGELLREEGDLARRVEAIDEELARLRKRYNSEDDA